jgi:hypothetical protein
LYNFNFTILLCLKLAGLPIVNVSKHSTFTFYKQSLHGVSGLKAPELVWWKEWWFTRANYKGTDSNLRVIQICLRNPTTASVCLLDSILTRSLLPGDDPFFSLLYVDQDCIKTFIEFHGG